MNTEYVHRSTPEYGCPCGWMVCEKDDIRCNNPSTHWSPISGLVYCDEHTEKFVNVKFYFIKLD